MWPFQAIQTVAAARNYVYHSLCGTGLCVSWWEYAQLHPTLDRINQCDARLTQKGLGYYSFWFTTWNIIMQKDDLCNIWLPRPAMSHMEIAKSNTCYCSAIISTLLYRCSVTSREVRLKDCTDYSLLWYYNPPGDCCAFDECGLLCQEVWWKRQGYLLQSLWGTSSFIFISGVWSQCEQSTINNHIWTLSHWNVYWNTYIYTLKCSFFVIILK